MFSLHATVIYSFIDISANQWKVEGGGGKVIFSENNDVRIRKLYLETYSTIQKQTKRNKKSIVETTLRQCECMHMHIFPGWNI